MDVVVTCDFPGSPNVIGKHAFTESGRTLQLDGHLDTIAAPHAPAHCEDGWVYGRGACDMKGGLACMLEAVRVLVDGASELSGTLMVSAHSLHEMPDGRNEPLDEMIAQGYYGDAVIIGECGSDTLPLDGLGMAIFDIYVERDGQVLHETKGQNVPNPVSYAGEILTSLISRAQDLRESQSRLPETLFIGQVHCGDFYNRIPTVCHIQGTRRWPPTKSVEDIRLEFDQLLSFARAWEPLGIRIRCDVMLAADSFHVSADEDIVSCLTSGYAQAHGRDLSLGHSVITGNAPWFVRDAGVPCVYHGPDQSTAHGDVERVALSDLVGVVRTYVATAVCYLGAHAGDD